MLEGNLVVIQDNTELLHYFGHTKVEKVEVQKDIDVGEADGESWDWKREVEVGCLSLGAGGRVVDRNNYLVEEV